MTLDMMYRQYQLGHLIDNTMKLTDYLLFLFILTSASTALAEKLVTISTPRDIEQSFLLTEPETTPRAILVQFPGIQGVLNLSENASGIQIGQNGDNFVVRIRQELAKRGFIVATVDAPPDRKDDWGMWGGFRTSKNHVQDIDSIIAWLSQRTDLPVWLHGFSRGTESAAYVGLHTRQPIAGIILSSSMTKPNPRGTAVTELPLERLKLPVLVIHHVDDRCHVTTPQGARKIHEMLGNSTKTKLALFEGGDNQGRDCGPLAYHGFLGIESRVISTINSFIQSDN